MAKKIVREVKRVLDSEFPGWRLRKSQRGSAHYAVTNGKRQIWLASSPSTGHETVIKNLRQQIRRIESGRM